MNKIRVNGIRYNKINPCKCGVDLISIDEEKIGWLYYCGIMCMNPECHQPFVDEGGLTRKRAMKKAVKKWNRSVKR